VFVVDEYGVVQGLLTPHDLLEAITGELQPGGEAEAWATRREDGSWLLDGMIAVDEMRHLLGIKAEPTDDNQYNTLGGFVMARLGRIPSTGDRFEWEGAAFEVLDMDGHRVDRVLVTPSSPSPASR